MEKLPPVEKVFEAWTAIADGRIEMHENSATVSSSDGAKSYTVRWNDNNYSSDDNATFWRGYAGYPVLAVMMLQGLLPCDKSQLMLWKNVNWKELNTRYRNNYSKAVEEVASQRNIDLKVAYSAAETVIEKLKNIPIELKRKI